MAKKGGVPKKPAENDVHLKVSQDFFEETMYWLHKILAGQLFAVGARVGESLAQRLYFNRKILKGKDGFEKCVKEFENAGLGKYAVSKAVFEESRAIVVCRNSTEASAVLKEEGVVSEPVCDYARGVLVAFMRFNSGRFDCSGVETKCVAKGDECCEFVIGEQATGVDEWLKSF